MRLITLGLALLVAAMAAAVEVAPAEMDAVQAWMATAFPADGAAPCFSFTYGGKPSGELLRVWGMTRPVRALDASRTEYTLTSTEPGGGLSVRCVAVTYKDYPVVEWTPHFTNTDAADTAPVSDINAIDVVLPVPPGDVTLHSHTGDICAPESYQPRAEVLQPGAERTIANTGGRPTQTEFPYFNIQWDGGGVICVISWAGQWHASFARGNDNTLRIRAGQEQARFVLHPGETVRAPMMVLQFYQGDRVRSQNIWRRWMLAHNVPRPDGKPLAPQSSLCNGNYYPNLMTVASQELAFIKRHVEADVPFTIWWQDAGWYPCDGVGWPKVGTWEVDPGRFPNGIRELSDYVHAQGRKSMVWFEPERVHAGTWLTDNHPEWVLGGKDGGLLNLGEPACREWLTEHIDQILTGQHIDYYRQDFNMDPLKFWRENDTADRQGITEIRHIEGYYAYWDELRRRHPDLLIDSCASGGRRNDLETMRRAVPLLRSDWYAGEAGMQCLTYGLSAWLPYHGNGFIYNKDAYWIRSAMAAEMSYGPGTGGVEHTDFAELRRLTAEHLQVAPCFLGDFYPLTPYTLAEDVWMAWQFDLPERGTGVVQVFRRRESPYESASFPLQALDASAQYRVRNLDEPEARTVDGAALLKGLAATAPKKATALTLTYERLP